MADNAEPSSSVSGFVSRLDPGRLNGGIAPKNESSLAITIESRSNDNNLSRGQTNTDLIRDRNERWSLSNFERHLDRLDSITTPNIEFGSIFDCTNENQSACDDHSSRGGTNTDEVDNPVHGQPRFKAFLNGIATDFPGFSSYIWKTVPLLVKNIKESFKLWRLLMRNNDEIEEISGGLLLSKTEHVLNIICSFLSLISYLASLIFLLKLSILDNGLITKLKSGGILVGAFVLGVLFQYFAYKIKFVAT